MLRRSDSVTRLARIPWVHLATLLVAGIAIWTVTSTYTVLSHTADEPINVASGLEWFEQGTHRLKPENPPLAQLCVAVWARQAGHRLPVAGAPFQRGTELLYTDGDYLRNLALARLGALPFFLVAIGVVWVWTFRFGGGRAAFVAAASFCTLPPVLGHAGLATTDVPFLAMFLLALYRFVRWLESPTIGRSLLFGLGLGLASITKFSVLVFFPCCVVAIVLLRWVMRKRDGESAAGNRFVGGAAIALLVGALVVWSCFRFSVGSLADMPSAQHLIRTCFPEGDGYGRRIADWISRRSCPAPEGVLGLLSLYAHVAQGHSAYLLGQESDHGFWNFYPVALSVKTPISFALMSLAGLIGVLRVGRERGWQLLAPAAGAIAILIAAMPSTINIGVRHVLVIYPLLAITAGLGLDQLFRRARGRGGRMLMVSTGLLLLIQASLVPRVHPNYLAYFNPLAGREPGRVLLDSDLDWGQDLLQLAEYFEGRDVERLHIATFGSVRLCEHDLPPLRWLDPGEPVTGWVAISEMYFRDHWHMTYSDPCNRRRARESQVRGGYAWLERYEPVSRVGGSIRVYRIPDG